MEDLLQKALYGCITPAKLWFDKLRKVLKNHGFESNPCNHCVMNNVINDEQITIGFHLDVLLVTCANDKYVDDVVEYLKSEFSEGEKWTCNWTSRNVIKL